MGPQATRQHVIYELAPSLAQAQRLPILGTASWTPARGPLPAQLLGEGPQQSVCGDLEASDLGLRACKPQGPRTPVRCTPSVSFHPIIGFIRVGS